MVFEFKSKIIRKCCSIPLSVSVLIILSNLATLSDNTFVYAGQDRALNIVMSHSGKGQAEICLKNEGYSSICDDYNLAQERDPLVILVDVEDAEVGDDYVVCYEFKDSSSEECKDFRFNDQNPQTVNISINEMDTITDAIDNDDLLTDEQPALPSLPPIPPIN